MTSLSMGGGLPILRNLGNHLLDNNRPNGQRKPPSGSDTVLKWLWNEPEFSQFLSLVYLADMNDYLDRCTENFTLFAPSNMSMEKHTGFLCELGRAKARQIVITHLTKYPFQLKDICGNVFETPDIFGRPTLIDGRFTPYRVGKSTSGLVFGINWDVVANMASGAEFSVGNGVIHPIDGFLRQSTPQP